MVREIVMMGDPVLRKRAAPVESFDDKLQKLVDDMYETMYHAEGIGLAANQIGVLQQVLVIDIRDEKDAAAGRMALINPRIVMVTDDLDREAEGCLSIPGIEDVVERPWGVRVEAVNPKGEPVSVVADALLARALQHEIDHLEGILFIDRVSPLKRRMLLDKWKKAKAEKIAEKGEKKAAR
jgi:peptide deformylase